MADHRAFSCKSIHAEDMSHKREIRVWIIDVPDRDQSAENRYLGGHQDFESPFHHHSFCSNPLAPISVAASKSLGGRQSPDIVHSPTSRPVARGKCQWSCQLWRRPEFNGPHERDIAGNDVLSSVDCPRGPLQARGDSRLVDLGVDEDRWRRRGQREGGLSDRASPSRRASAGDDDQGSHSAIPFRLRN
jgi:hypothetical protein